MQAFDKNDRVVESGLFDRLKEAENAAHNALQKAGVEYVRIGRFPEVGNVLAVNGMQFRVVMANQRKRRFTLEML
jgi:Mg2+/Co2+ transporter CorC